MDFDFDLIDTEDYERIRELHEPLAHAVRRLIDASIHTGADAEDIRRAREAIDDVRYSTLMLRLASEAEASADFDTRSAGRQARLLLARLTPESVDATSLRMEVIHHITRLRETLGK